MHKTPAPRRHSQRNGHDGQRAPDHNSDQDGATLREQLEDLYDRYGHQLFAAALAVTGCRDRAEDAVHEAFCKLLRHTRPVRNLRAYAFRAVRNAAVDTLRAGARTVAMTEGMEQTIFDTARGPRDNAQLGQLGQHVDQALRTLSDDERETIVGHLWGDLTFQEIADMRRRPLGTITSWYRRGIGKLRQRMEEKEQWMTLKAN